MRISDWSSDVCSSDLLSPELAGIVDEISFKSGEDIKAGAVLVKLRAADDVARLDALRASAELAQSIYSRDKAQLEAHAISQAALDSSAANLKTAKAQVDEQEALEIGRAHVGTPVNNAPMV